MAEKIHTNPTCYGSQAHAVAELERKARQVRTIQHFLMGCEEPPHFVAIYPSAWGVTLGVLPNYDLDKEAAAAVWEHRILECVRWMKRIAGTVTKKADEVYMTYEVTTPTNFRITLNVARTSVCTAKVVGTETVEVPDPNATKTVTRDVIEYDCHPLLAVD